MIRLLNIQIEGFCSVVEPQTVPLNVGGTVLVKAPNGFGKTTLFSAIAWVLYGKNLKGNPNVNTWKRYQPKNYKGTKVTLIFDSDKGVYQVTRCLKYTGKLDDGAKGGDRIILVREGETLNIKGKVKLQEAINQAMGCSYELFTSSIMFGQGMKRLIQESNADKKKLFEEIFNLEYLNVARSIAQQERNEVYSKYQEVESEAASLERELSLLQRSYNELKEKEDTFNDQNKQAIKKQKEKLQVILQRYKELSKGVNEDEDFGELYQSIKSSIQQMEEDIEDVERIQDVPLLELVQDTVNLLEAKKTKRALTNLRRILASFRRAEKLRKDIRKARERMEDARVNYRKQENLLKELENLEERANDIRSEIKELKSSQVKETSPKYLKKIAKAKKSLEGLSVTRKRLEAELEDYNWVLNDPLSNNGIKTFLFDSSLQALNDNLERYAEILGFRIEFNVDLDSARKDFVTLIERDGVIIDYAELSGGEKGLVNLTMCLALHETLTLSKDINLLLLDEVFENLDADNIELVISLIRSLSEGKTVFLISHIQNLPFGNCRVLEVCKNNGQTHYSHL